MKKFFTTFYGKLSAIFLILLIIMGIAQVLITLQSSTRFYSEADQKLNSRLAFDMANEFRPFLKDSINFAGIEQTIHYMMIMNPKIEIYLLDGSGKILAFFAEPQKKVQAKFVDVDPIRRFLAANANMPILGDDPRHIGRKKPFSVASLKIGQSIDGYLYIIIGSEQFDSAASTIRESYIVQTILKGLLVTLLFTGIIGLILFALLTRRLRRMAEVVRQFERGMLEKRIPVKSNDEVGHLAQSFNRMADTIVTNMDELKKNDNLRRELVANVSHDLRSPLASIQGYLETILMKDKTLTAEERNQFLQVILNNTTLLNNLVEQLFELSKLDARQVQPNPEPFSMAELAQDVVMKFKPRAEKRNVDLQAVLPENLPQVKADIGLIERALSNLIDNALRYTPEKGTVKVVLSNSHKRVRVLVSDTGNGISADDLPFIFDRFYRAEKSRARTTGGTGLGLAISKKILELHGSTITVESVVNVGTTFSFDMDASPRST